ncbi:unnamed protein product, partial [Rotaria magnacalcarata]
DFEGFSPATSYIQKCLRERDQLTTPPTKKSRKNDQPPKESDKIAEMLLNFQKSIEERMERQDRKLEKLDGSLTDQDTSEESDEKSSSDQDSDSGGEDLDLPVSLLQSQEFDYTPLDIDKDIKSKIVLKQAWPLIRGSFATHFKEAVIPKPGGAKKVNELQISEKALDL